MAVRSNSEFLIKNSIGARREPFDHGPGVHYQLVRRCRPCGKPLAMSVGVETDLCSLECAARGRPARITLEPGRIVSTKSNGGMG